MRHKQDFQAYNSMCTSMMYVCLCVCICVCTGELFSKRVRVCACMDGCIMYYVLRIGV